MSLAAQDLATLERMRDAQRNLRNLPSEIKNSVLEEAAETLLARTQDVLRANATDLDSLPKESTAAFRDRLALTPARIVEMADSLRQVARLPDPVGAIEEKRQLSNGLMIERVRAPLGTIFMIFESRPNVAIEAFSLGFKSGNAMILRGGKESRQTTGLLYEILRSALRSQGSRSTLTEDVLWGVTNTDRELSLALLQEARWIDVVVPRGGDSLIDFVVKNSKIPIIKNDRGMCHIYVHDDADLVMAEEIIHNAKTQRPSACNAAETILLHESIAHRVLPSLHAKMPGVEWWTCPKSLAAMKDLPRVHPATDESWDTEYLDFKINCKIVASQEEAHAHIHRHGSRHSEAIITNSDHAARFFEREIDAAVVYWNASTRFTDGYSLGLGGELGISTQKLHVRGPVGLKELTSLRWVIEGNGQVRL